MFEHPTWWILAGVAFAMLGVLGWRARRVCARRCRTLGVSAQPWSKSRFLALAGALGLLAIAAIGLRWGTSSVATAAGHDVTIVIDASRSMLAKDAMPDRLSRAKELAREVVASLAGGGNRVAVVTFAAQPKVVVPLTYDLNHARSTIADIEIDSTLGDISGTRIGAGLQQALHTLAVGRGAGLVLLFSDGDDPVSDGEWLHGADAAANAHIPVSVIGIGDATRDSSVPDRPDARTRLHESTLKELATRTGGKYVAAKHGDGIASQFVKNLLAERPRVDDPTLVTARASAPVAPFLAGAIFLLTLGLVGMRWQLLAAAAAIATVSAAPIDDWLRRGDAALAAGHAEQALAWYAKAEGRTPDPGLVAFNEGVALVALGRYRDAELHFQWSLSDAVGDRRIRALYNLGTSLVRRCAGRERAALQAAITAFETAQREMPPDHPLAADVQNNLAIAKDMLARLPVDQPNAPSDGESSEPDKPTPNKQQDKPKTAPGDSPKSTDQVGPPGKGNLPPIADTDEPTPITAQDFDEHLRRAVDRINAAKRDRLRAKSIDKPTKYPDW